MIVVVGGVGEIPSLKRKSGEPRGPHQSTGEALIRLEGTVNGRWCDGEEGSPVLQTQYLKIILVILSTFYTSVFYLGTFHLPAVQACGFYPSCWPMRKAQVFISVSDFLNQTCFQ